MPGTGTSEAASEEPGHVARRRGASVQKRQRLVDAAWQLMYARGVARTTLATIAERADVPLGNIYYYFPTREALIEAVLEHHVADLRKVLARWDAEALDDLAPLLRYIRAQIANSEKIAEQGCHHARLASDLSQEPGFRDRAGAVLALYLAWVEHRFTLLEVAAPHDAAVELVGRVQGGIALATAFARPELLVAEMERAERWLLGQARRSDARDGAPHRHEPWGTATDVC